MESKFVYQVFVDSDAFVGYYYLDDPHHKKAKAIFETLEKNNLSIVTSSIVILEVATVLSHRSGQSLASSFLEMMEKSDFPVIHITETLQEQGLRLFNQQSKKGTSVADCFNVVVMKQFSISKIFSFDSFYRSFGLTYATEELSR